MVKLLNSLFHNNLNYFFDNRITITLGTIAIYYDIRARNLKFTKGIVAELASLHAHSA